MEIGHELTKSTETIAPEKRWRKWCDVAILVFGNFIMYSERYTLAGVLPDVQRFFEIDNDLGGVIQSVYIIAYLVTAPIYGYLGDRYDRKLLLVYSLVAWNAGSLGCSFVNRYWVFLLLRAVFGMGQSCYVTVAPTIIGDLFVGDARSKVLVAFYLAVPMGSGLGYTIGAEMTHCFGDWRWSVRATPALSLVMVLLIIGLLRDPYRGHIEGKHHMPKGTWLEDIRYLTKNKSFIFCTLAYSSVSFAMGAIYWWSPKVLVVGFSLRNTTDVSAYRLGSIYGVITTTSGFLALCLGYLLTFKFKTYFQEIEPVVCAVGLIVSAPLMSGATFLVLVNATSTFTVLFFALLTANLNWAIICDIILKVVVPVKRSSAVGLQLMIGHSLGDAGSPYFLGLLADLLHQHYQKSVDDDHLNEFKGLQVAFFVASAVELLGAMFFSLTAAYMRHDSERAWRGSISV